MYNNRYCLESYVATVQQHTRPFTWAKPPSALEQSGPGVEEMKDSVNIEPTFKRCTPKWMFYNGNSLLETLICSVG